ncbi:hypothetical protein [Methanoplanus limicola]|uniref:Uncharacterized protein n=1 Tax=Methanoplanus limicola DSM 2279 TaxID=937775 RepID=H1Z223_9EURY|nr:hypothetical protein [Methanoplanus limicola]EHQ36368.1 hypothetical protein Metlim_2313 [Methanoplanus limicola DSM 2279]
MTIPENESRCEFCGKDAIGIQILGCCKQVVCEEHAEKILKEMKPGERKEWGACYYVRY